MSKVKVKIAHIKHLQNEAFLEGPRENHDKIVGALAVCFFFLKMWP
jgi:hypothetical protein